MGQVDERTEILAIEMDHKLREGPKELKEWLEADVDNLIVAVLSLLGSRYVEDRQVMAVIVREEFLKDEQSN